MPAQSSSSPPDPAAGLTLVGGNWFRLGRRTRLRPRGPLARAVAVDDVAGLVHDVTTGVGDRANYGAANPHCARCGVPDALPNRPAAALGSDHCHARGE